MEHIPFVKYQGAGNDFIMIDDRVGVWAEQINEAWIAAACHRRFGIGADGLILLQTGTDGADFFMRYYNSDGRASSFCGNGGRCIVAFAYALKVHTGSCRFLGTDGWHEGIVLKDRSVKISMKDIDAIEELDQETVTLNTGSPHYIHFVKGLEGIDVFREGRAIRNSPAFGQEGINVNFVESIAEREIAIRTYERGVEDETFACGTGVVAAAIGTTFLTGNSANSWLVHAKGGDLRVDFQRNSHKSFSQVWLTGPAAEVFEGQISL